MRESFFRGKQLFFDIFLRRKDKADPSPRLEPMPLAGTAVAVGDVGKDKRKAVDLAAAYLMDDLSPKVRMSLAETVADDPSAPRTVILALTDDRADIAATVVARSPVLNDKDLIDIVARGTRETRAAVAVRSSVSGPVAAALTEVGGRLEIALLLRNEQSQLTPNVMVRLASRCGSDATIRELMLDRPDLPATARHVLIEKAGDVLSQSDLVMAVLPPKKRERMRREACDLALIRVLGSADDAELAEVVEYLREEGRLSTLFLIQALCAGRTAFFAEVVANLSGIARHRARSILASGRPRAVRALLEAAGIDREVSAVFCEAVAIWREEGGDLPGTSGIFLRLVERARSQGGFGEKALSLVDAVERMAIAEMRQMARNFAHELLREAA